MKKTRPTMKNTKATNSERNAEEERHDEKPCNILQLPDHVTQEIFCRIPLKTLIQCKFVCKSWHRSLSNPDFTKTLVYSGAPTCHFLLDLETNKHILADVKSAWSPNNMVLKLSDPNALYNRVNDSYILGSSNGLLCLVRHNHKIGSVYFNISNLIIGESIALPIFKDRYNVPLGFAFGFGYSSISHVYKVVLFIRRNPPCKKLKCMVLTVGYGIWRSIGKVCSSIVYTIYGVFHNGFLHWLCDCKRSRSRFIHAFDVESERFKNLSMPPACETAAKLGVLNGSLSISCFSLGTFKVWLMKEYGGKKFWTRELEIHDTIQDRRMTIGDDTCWEGPLSKHYIEHPEEAAEPSDIKIPAWTTSVAGWGKNDESEVVEIPRGQPTPCLPLPKDLKHASAATASTLLDMISGLNALLLHKCMVGKDEIKRLRKENEELRASVKLLSGRPGECDFVQEEDNYEE
nr:MYB transcription factor protein [Rosa persica]